MKITILANIHVYNREHHKNGLPQKTFHAKPHWSDHGLAESSGYT